MSGPSELPPAVPAAIGQEDSSGTAPAEPLLVGIGVSAGGLDALSELLKALPPVLPFGIVVLQHLDPRHDSQLVRLLGRAAALPVRWLAEGDAIQPGTVYVVPPHTCVHLQGRIASFSAHAHTHHDIDFLFRSLATEAREAAIGIVLSGNGDDGTAGLQAIREAGGVTFAQEPGTASFPGMPQAALAAGVADRVLSPTEIAKALLQLLDESGGCQVLSDAGSDAEASEREQEQMALLFRLVAARTGVDFSDYKPSTIKRRLLRRMMMTNVSELARYVSLLHRQHDELQRLYESLLINVSDFFRDADCFEFLRQRVLPDIVARHPEDLPIRVWVPGCATGEEVYSLGIVLREAIEEAGRFVPVQIFGTDVSDAVIARARAGLYLPGEVTGVTPERLRRFFSPSERGFTVQKSIRDMCIFARQNVARDAPFSRLDLLSCRNLLIYFSPKLQRKLMPVFHYALAPEGYLVLGNSESVGSHPDLYRLLDRRFRIYARKSALRRTPLDFSPDPTRLSAPPTPATHPAPMADDTKDPLDIIQKADRLVLDRYAPSGVVVNEQMEILQFRGDVSPFLAPFAGRATLNLIKMAREGLGAELQVLMQEARERNAPLRKAGVVVMHDTTARLVDLDVTPLESSRSTERYYLILFAMPELPLGTGPTEAEAGKPIPESAVVQQLRHELHTTRSYLQATIERHETINQDLRAANEEIQSSNEELQSTNEEFETAKEELQSTNEELTIVNEELHRRQLELVQINNDLHNLINSVHLPIVILGADLRIRRFTPMAEKILNMIPTDIGRPLSDINIGLEVADLPQLIAEVVESLTARELEVRDRAGRWYSLRLRPYKTAERKIDGAVLTLVDIEALKRAVRAAEEAHRIAQTMMELAGEPMAIFTTDLRVVRANEPFYRLFGTDQRHLEGQPFFETAGQADALVAFRDKLAEVLPITSGLTHQRVGFDLPGAGPGTLDVSLRQMSNGDPLLFVALRMP